jgi:acyl-phosphate glycerol 3-phosphate acyltransferase
MTVILAIATALAGYFVGAVPFGYLVARWRGVDIFAHGSGNIGATNVGRVLGRGFGIVVFALDFAKGALPTAAGLALGAAFEVNPPALLGVAAGLGAFVGHLYPVYLHFRGGKGVATGAGVVLVLLPLATVAALLTWVMVVAAFGYVSLASLAAAAVLCLVHLAGTPAPFEQPALILTVFCLLAVTLVFVKHRANLSRLWHGTENRLQERPAMRHLIRTVHVLAVGLWFGMAVFFSFPVALSLFGAFEKQAESSERPSWFPLPEAYTLEPGMQKDQGTRAAGFAISPLFDQYFLWQGVCGFLAVVTALSWTRAEPGRRVHGLRFVVLVLAVTTVVLGWPIEQQVSELRHKRNEASDALLARLRADKSFGITNGREAEALRHEAVAARQEFGVWHLWSLLLNMVTILLVTIAMALAAQLPAPATTAARARQAAMEAPVGAPS